MANHTLTREDLLVLKKELFEELRKLKEQIEQVAAIFQPPRKWLKSYEVRDLMGISGGTLQNLRNKGTLTYKKVGGLMYYKYSDVLKLMEG